MEDTNAIKFNFNTVSGVRFGWDSVVTSSEEIRRTLGPRVLIVSDQELSRIGLYKPLMDNLIKRGVEVRVFDQVDQDPTLKNLEMAIESGGGFLVSGIGPVDHRDVGPRGAARMATVSRRG